MTPDLSAGTLRLGLPKGRMQDGVLALLADAGLPVRASQRAYRPTIATGNFNTKVLKPQNIIEMLAADSRDVGFAGADWVAELGVDVVELLDTGLAARMWQAASPSTHDRHRISAPDVGVGAHSRPRCAGCPLVWCHGSLPPG